MLLDLLLEDRGPEVRRTKFRKYANTEDTLAQCVICDEFFGLGQRIFFSLNKKPVHVYRCRREYMAVLVVFYNLTAAQLVISLDMSPRTAARVIKKSKELSA